MKRDLILKVWDIIIQVKGGSPQQIHIGDEQWRKEHFCLETVETFWVPTCRGSIKRHIERTSTEGNLENYRTCDLRRKNLRQDSREMRQ
jgi:hypothetical protein